MYKYERVVYWSCEDEAFLVEIPELPGCMADGATIEEANRNADKIILEWIQTATEEGRIIPEPRGRFVFT